MSLSPLLNEPALFEESAAEEGTSSLLTLSLERGALLKSLSHVQSVVERRNTIPILSNVKLEAAGGKLKLTATDMDLAVIEEVDAAITREGAVTVPAHTFYDIVRKLPDGVTINLAVSEEDAGRLVITAGACKFALSCLSAQEFPVMDEGAMSHHFSLASAEIRALIDKTRFAISTEETRYYLNGIYLHVVENENGAVLRAAATDGHRLARMEVSMPEGASGMPGIILPRKAVLELKKLVEEGTENVAVSVSSSKIRFSYGTIVLLSKLIDGTFPDYEKVIPAGNDKIMELNTDLFTKAVDRVSTISSEKSRGIKFSLEPGKLILSAAAESNGTAREELEANYTADGFEIGFNSRYVLDMMAVLEGDMVQFSLADGASPAVVRDPADIGALYVIMPMRV